MNESPNALVLERVASRQRAVMLARAEPFAATSALRGNDVSLSAAVTT